MREDFQETLEKMFPKGYIITQIQPNGEPAYSWFNPNEDEYLCYFLELLQRIMEGSLDE